MKKSYYILKPVLIGLMLLVFMFSFLANCQAARPKFQAKHNRQNKEAQMNISITLPEYELVEEGEWMVLRCNDSDSAKFLKKGEPELFSLTYYISIPQGATVKNLTVKPEGKHIELGKAIKPVPEDVPIGSPPKPPIPDEEIYSSTKPYPKEDFEYSIGKKGSTTMLVLTVYPLKYIGKYKTLIVNEYMEVDVILKSDKWMPNPQPRNAVDRNLKKRLVNPESAFFSKGGAQ
jgi:hypothetical protein